MRTPTSLLLERLRETACPSPLACALTTHFSTRQNSVQRAQISCIAFSALSGLGRGCEQRQQRRAFRSRTFSTPAVSIDSVENRPLRPQQPATPNPFSVEIRRADPRR